MNTENTLLRRIPWYLLTGVLVGLGLGLLYAWVISPVKYVDTAPISLRADFKDQYRLLIALAYSATGDLGQAQSRLTLLGDADPVQSLTDQAQRALASGDPDGSASTLHALANTLGQTSPNQASPTPLIAAAETTTPVTASDISTLTPVYTPTQGPSPTPTPTPVYTPTPRPTHTPTPTPGSPFVLMKQENICDAALPEGLMQIEVQDAARQAIPGAEIIISWDSGEEHFFTGLKPELGDGYADYKMTPGILYTVQLASGSAPISGLSAPACQAGSGNTYWGGIHLVFQQP